MDGPKAFAPVRERIFNAPLAAVLVAASIPASYLLQTVLPDQGLSHAFQPSSLVNGGWWPDLLTSMYVHFGWMHAGLNAAFALAFGPPVARLFPGARGAPIFFAYYIVCGLVGTLGYAAFHLDSAVVAGGASGAVFGLMGGAIRLLGGQGRVRPLNDRRVWTITLAVMGVNLVTGLLNIAPGVESAGIAWEAHAAGYLCGLLLIGPLARVSDRSAHVEAEG